MRSITGTIFLGVIVFVVAFSTLAVAGDESYGLEIGRSYEIYSIRGETAANGQLALSIIPGRFVDRSIKVVSQPSNTVLAVVLDTDFLKSAEGQIEIRTKTDESEPQATAATSLPEGSPRFVIEGRPATDDRVQVWVNSSLWPDGGSGERLIADGLVGTGHDFGFSTSTKIGPKSPSREHCCWGGPCGTMCIDCGDSRFECCLGPDCCLIVCEWEADCINCE